MAGQRSTRHEFVAETNGLCFLCSNKTFPTSWGSESPSPGTSSSIYSLHCLSRYLKLDMRKVFTGDGPIPPDLMAKVEKAGLSVELCEECVVLIEKLSKQVRLLEKIEMEVNSGLELVRKKLESALKLGNFNDLTNEWMAKLEIANALRKDAMHKCSRNFHSLLPLTKLEKLTPKQIGKEKVKLRRAAESKCSSIKHTESIYEDDNSGNPAMSSLETKQGSDYLYEQNPPPPSPPFADEGCDMEAEDVKHEVLEEEQANAIKFEDILEPQHQSASKSNSSGIAQLRQAIPPPVKVAREVVDFTKSTIAKLDGFKCSKCKKSFNTKTHYTQHYLSVHLGVKYKCRECASTFSRKEHLTYHQNSVHLGKSFQCNYCSKTFSMPYVRNRHMRLNCSGRKSLAVADDR